MESRNTLQLLLLPKFVQQPLQFLGAKEHFLHWHQFNRAIAMFHVYKQIHNFYTQQLKSYAAQCAMSWPYCLAKLPQFSQKTNEMLALLFSLLLSCCCVTMQGLRLCNNDACFNSMINRKCLKLLQLRLQATLLIEFWFMSCNTITVHNLWAQHRAAQNLTKPPACCRVLFPRP